MSFTNVEGQKTNENRLKLKQQKENIFPYEIKLINPQLNSELLDDFSGEKTGYMQIGPKKWFLRSRYIEAAEDIYNLKLRSDDVFVVTFPRSGTTWTQEIVWLICNDLDYETAKNTPLMSRFLFLEGSMVVHREIIPQLIENCKGNLEACKRLYKLYDSNWTKLCDDKEERRFFKTHLPFSLLPPNITKAGCKIIYIARNPKDVAASYYEFNRCQILLGYSGDFPTFWRYFEQNVVWGPYWEHIKEGWARRHEENVLFLFYENMNKGLRPYLDEIASFLGKSYTSEELDKLNEHVKIDNLRNNKSVSGDTFKVVIQGDGLISKGRNGRWRDYFDKELEKRADKWIEENLRDTDLRFPEV